MRLPRSPLTSASKASDTAVLPAHLRAPSGPLESGPPLSSGATGLMRAAWTATCFLRASDGAAVQRSSAAPAAGVLLPPRQPREGSEALIVLESGLVQ